MKNTNKALPTGQVAAVLGLSPRTIYNYLRDYGEHFSEGARIHKKGKRFISNDVAKLQTIRHLLSEHRSSAEINQALKDGYLAPLEGGHNQEDINRLVEASWIFLQEAKDIQAKTMEQFRRCEFCEWDLRYHIENGFYKTILRYEQFEHELNQIKLIVGTFSNSHKAQLMRDDEYERLDKWIRFHFLDDEERRRKRQVELDAVGVETAKARLELVHDTKALTGWLYARLPHRTNGELLPAKERRKVVK